MRHSHFTVVDCCSSDIDWSHYYSSSYVNFKKITEVEKNNDLTLKINITSSDELGSAAVNINKML